MDEQRTHSEGAQPPAPSTLAEYWEQVRRHHRYNATLHVTEGMFSFFGLTCFAPETVLATYVGLLTKSKLLIALPWALFVFSWSFPQLFLAYFLQLARQRRRIAIYFGAANRLPLLLLALSALLVPRLGFRFGLIALFTIMGVNVLFAGMGMMTWQELLGRIIAPEKRGRFFGLKQATGMLAAVAAAYCTGSLLLRLGDKDPQSYAGPFFIGFAFFSFALFLISLSREPYYPREREPVRGWWRYVRGCLGLIKRDRNFARYVAVRVLLPFAYLFPISLYAAYAQEIFNVAPSTVVGYFTPMNYVGQVLFAPLAGWIGDRFGFKSLLVISAVATASSLGAGLTLGYWGEAVTGGFMLVYFLFGVGYVANVIGNMNIVLEFAHVEDRPAYMGVAATFGAVGILLVPVLGGWLVDRIDYVPVMAISLAVALVVAGVSAVGFQEPRKEHPDLSGLGLAQD